MSPCWPRLCMPLLSYRSGSCSCIGRFLGPSCEEQLYWLSWVLSLPYGLDSTLAQKYQNCSFTDVFILHLVSLGCSRPLLFILYFKGGAVKDWPQFLNDLFFFFPFYFLYWVLSFSSSWRLFLSALALWSSVLQPALRTAEVREKLCGGGLCNRSQKPPHAASAEEPDSAFVCCFLPSLSLFCFC